MSLIALLESKHDKPRALRVDLEALAAALRVFDEALATGALGPLATEYVARRRRDTAAHAESLRGILNLDEDGGGATREGT